MNPGMPEPPGELEQIIREEIRARGPITFARFMELALYHPALGYYNTSPAIIGRGGDFYTSASLHPAFGWLVARQMVQMWDILGRPADFTIAEMGAGRGYVCTDILSHLASDYPDCFAAAGYVIFERSAAMSASQREMVSNAGFEGKVRWLDFHSPDTRPFTGVFFSNELIDAFPVHQVFMAGGGLLENHVLLEGDRLATAALPLSDARLAEYFTAAGVELLPGQTAEVNLEAARWAARAASLIEKGFAITIDYGYEAKKLYGPSRPHGTLMCYCRHTANSSPLEQIGLQDITAHVDFTTLAAEGEKHGLLRAGLTNQTFFLINLGLPDIASAPPAEDDTPQKLMNRNFSFKKMIDPDGLGHHTVLVQYKGLAECPPLDCLKILP